ncbi:MAG: DUF2520 domain-containing protein [Ignavibacteriae bacterium]|nr:DUF2520 domain-containing protein [Ignavibacteriota bacterium]
MKNNHLLPTTIIGAGAVGSTLAHALHKKGYPIVSVISMTETSAKKLAGKVHSKIASTELKDIDFTTRLIIIAVPDSAVFKVSHSLARLKTLNFKKILVAHTSGMYPASTLNTIKKKGASVASLHPIQTFPKVSLRKSQPISLNGIYYGVDCKKEALGKIKNIINDLNGNMVIIPSRLRHLYHTTCVFSSSYFVMLTNIVSELSKELQLNEPWQKVFGPLTNTAINNARTNFPADALTGPILRGDIFGVLNHMVALEQFAPEFLLVYTFGALEIARIAACEGLITEQQHKEIGRMFSDLFRQTNLSPKRKVTK